MLWCATAAAADVDGRRVRSSFGTRFSNHPSEPWKSVVRAIDDGAGNVLVGLCGVAILRGAEEGEIWYLVSPELWGKGIATEAAKELLALGFGELGLHRIWASCLPENPASERVLQKAGMRKEGFLVKNLKIHGVWKSSFLYAMLADEWDNAASTRKTVLTPG